VYDRVLVAARGPAPVVEQRVRALAQWYGVKADLRPVAGGAVTLAALGTTVAGAYYGEAPPGALDILRATDLRRYSGGGVALAYGMDRARIVGGAGAPGFLHAAHGPEVGAWSTHAVAAAVVARGSAAVEADALGEHLAIGFVGGGGSLVAGVRALPVATLVDLDATRAHEVNWWPAADRWRPAGALDAALRETLRDRLAGLRDVKVADDAPAADRALAGLRVAAERWPITPAAPDPAVARWTDGSISLPRWPVDADVLVIDGRIPVDALAPLDRLDERLAGVDPEIARRTLERITAWRDADFAAAGVRGPRLYAVLGFEEHLARGLRTHVSPARTPLVAALATPAVQRVLPWEAPPPSESLGVASGLSAATREWIADDVFEHRLAAGLGARWCSRTRSRFLAGHTAATTLALRLAGAVALEDAMGDLPPLAGARK
jgi:hypothetical protein